LEHRKVIFNFHFSPIPVEVVDTLFKAEKSVREGSFQIRLRRKGPLRLRSKENFRKRRFVVFVGEAANEIRIPDFYENLGKVSRLDVGRLSYWYGISSLEISHVEETQRSCRAAKVHICLNLILVS
jgi:hypothetical protein